MGAGLAAFWINDNVDRQQRDRIRRLKLIRSTLRDLSNPFLLPEPHFRRQYRLTPHLALEFINLVRHEIEGDRISTIPAHLQVLAVLRFLSEGSFQKGVSNDFNHPMSQPSVSRCLDRVLAAILLLTNRFIRFPTSRVERQRIEERFRRFNRIPGIIGLIDCFKVAFVRPVENEEAFFNYNAGISMNVQVVADADFIIRSIRICPGSNTDQFIWRFSDVKNYMDFLRANANVLEEGPYYLLADNGYTPSPVLLTPILDAAEGSPEARFTQEHVSTRCKIEQCFGILTNVWHAISRARKLYYSPDKVSKIILACAILHNFRKMNGVQDPIFQYNEENYHQEIHQDREYEEGLQERNRVINLYYNN